MVSIEEHKLIAKVFLKDIEEKVKNDIVVERQKLIGFSASEAACNLFAIFLHKNNLITPGFNINHRFFASEKLAKSHFPFDFEHKTELLSLLTIQEDFRSKLCYGKMKEAGVVESTIQNLNKTKKLIESILEEEL